MVQITFVQETEVTFLLHRRENPLFPPLEMYNRMFKWDRFVTNRRVGEVCVAKSYGNLGQIIIQCCHLSFVIIQDGSLLDFTQGVFSDIFSIYSHVGSHTTPYDGETEACLSIPDKAVRFKFYHSGLGQDKSSRVQDCRELLNRIPTKDIFQWVLSHCGLWGKEMADLLEKRGSAIIQKQTCLFTQQNLISIGFLTNAFECRYQCCQK
ncbi:hypothetical protein TNCV_820851 [Trichonephila clavipes]|nr:hypothetical protein TNCV_820851 [Trichonephila clavipes]